MAYVPWQRLRVRENRAQHADGHRSGVLAQTSAESYESEKGDEERQSHEDDEGDEDGQSHEGDEDDQGKEFGADEE